MHETHPPLQTLPLPQCQCVSLGDHRDYVDFAVDGLHKLHIQWLQANNVNDKEKKKHWSESFQGDVWFTYS